MLVITSAFFVFVLLIFVLVKINAQSVAIYVSMSSIHEDSLLLLIKLGHLLLFPDVITADLIIAFGLTSDVTRTLHLSDK